MTEEFNYHSVENIKIGLLPVQLKSYYSDGDHKLHQTVESCGYVIDYEPAQVIFTGNEQSTLTSDELNTIAKTLSDIVIVMDPITSTPFYRREGVWNISPFNGSDDIDLYDFELNKLPDSQSTIGKDYLSLSTSKDTPYYTITVCKYLDVTGLIPTWNIVLTFKVSKEIGDYIHRLLPLAVSLGNEIYTRTKSRSSNQ